MCLPCGAGGSRRAGLHAFQPPHVQGRPVPGAAVQLFVAPGFRTGRCNGHHNCFNYRHKFSFSLGAPGQEPNPAQIACIR